MIEILDKAKCCGCHGCSNICPKSCISMNDDNEGFWYPLVDKDICVDCHLCEKVCPILSNPADDLFKPLVYACKNNDDIIREKSSSGGIFTLLCEKVIDMNGVVFGAAFDENFNVHHKYVETLADCAQFRGSKYVQSKIGTTYKEVKSFLIEGRIVLFTGTPCQIEGLTAYLRKEYDNLIKVDVACHGVPSPLIYRRYLDILKGKMKSKIKSLNFRDKKTGWNNYTFKVEFENGETYEEKGFDNIYMRGFLSDIFLRPSCYECEFKKPKTSADLTLADYWGVTEKHPEFSDEKGISLILVNNSKGERIFEQIKQSLKAIPSDFDYATQCNPSIISHAHLNSNRQKFFKLLNKGVDLENCILKSITPNLKQKIKWKLQGLKKRINKIIKKLEEEITIVELWNIFVKNLKLLLFVTFAFGICSLLFRDGNFISIICDIGLGLVGTYFILFYNQIFK